MRARPRASSRRPGSTTRRPALRLRARRPRTGQAIRLRASSTAAGSEWSARPSWADRPGVGHRRGSPPTRRACLRGVVQLDDGERGASGLGNCTDSQTEETVWPRRLVSVPRSSTVGGVDVAAHREDLVAREGRRAPGRWPSRGPGAAGRGSGPRATRSRRRRRGPPSRRLLPFAFEVARRRRLVTCRSAGRTAGARRGGPQVARRHELDDLLGVVARQRDRRHGWRRRRARCRPAGGPPRGSRPSVAYSEGDVAARWSARRGGVTWPSCLEAREEAQHAVVLAPPARASPRRRRGGRWPARTLRISSSSALTSYLPMREATSPRAVCASCSFSSRLLRTRRSPENVGCDGSSRSVVISRRVLLAVAVDAAVALLDADQATTGCRSG